MTLPHGPRHAALADWLADLKGKRNPGDEALLLDAADACDEAALEGALTDDRLRRVVAAASCPRSQVWYSATDLLRVLSGRWAIAADAIARMAAAPAAHVRFAAMCALGEQTPVDTTARVLRSGLLDRSSKVRWKAAGRANNLYRQDLVPAIEAAFAAETDAKTRASIELDLRLLRDGHWLQAATPGWHDLTVRLHNGLVNRRVGDEELAKHGLDALVLRLREEGR